MNIQNKIKIEDTKKSRNEDEINRRNMDHKVFIATLTMVTTELIDGISEKGELLNQILKVLPAKANEWQPLSWAVIDGNEVNEKDIKQLYISSPISTSCSRE